MKKIPILTLAAAVLLSGAYFFSRSSAEKNDQLQYEAAPAPTQTPGATVTPAAGDSAQAKGVYTSYSVDSIASTTGTKVLFFHAPWCPQCRALEKSITEGDIPAGVTIIKVDYDSNQQLRQKYGVIIQTTLVRVNDDGSLVEKYVAYEEPTLQALRDNLL